MRPQAELREREHLPTTSKFGGDAHSFGEFKIVNRAPFSSTPTVTVVPRIKVTFVMTDEMISGSAMSVTNVEIYDSTILAWGQAIPGFEAEYDR